MTRITSAFLADFDIALHFCLALGVLSVERYTELRLVFDKFFSKWEDTLAGCNYVVDIGLKGVDHQGENLDKESVLEKFLERDKSMEVEFIKSNSNQLDKFFVHFLVNANNYEPGHYDEALKENVRNKFIPKYFDFLKTIVSLENSRIYMLKNVEDHPVFNIFWSFTFLVIDSRRGNSPLIWAGASD